MKITQFYHDRRNNKTYAVDVDFDKDYLISLLYELPRSSVVEVKIGISQVHPLDKYNKKTGREVSAAKLEWQQLTLHGCYMDDNVIYFFLHDEKKELSYKFRACPNTSKVHFLEVDTYYDF